MSEILQHWLAERIALATDSTLDFIPQLARDGRIFGDLLYSYNIISYDQRLQIGHTDNDEKALRNLKTYVASWLKTIGIDCSQELLYDISIGKATAAIKLLYQMYLVLQDKDMLYFTNEKIRKGELSSPDSRFIVTRVPDEGPPLPKIEPNVLAQPLIDQNYTIQWHKGRLENLKEKCRRTREKYRKYLEEKFAEASKEPTKPVCVTVSDDKITSTIPLDLSFKQNQTYDELMMEEAAAKETHLVNADRENAREKLMEIVNKNRRKSEEKAKRLREQKVLLMEMWEKVIADQQQEFDNDVSKKLLQQSQYEKQMMTKMLQTRLQKDMMMEHRNAVENEIAKEKEHESLSAFMSRRSQALAQRENYYAELERKLELHRRLYAEKLRLKAERIYSMCLESVKDMVNVALKDIEFKEQFLMEAPRRVRDNWKHLFVKGEPIFEALEQPEDLVQGCVEELPEQMEEIYSTEMSRQNTLDEVDFENYLEYKWPFDLERHGLYDEDTLSAVDVGLKILSHTIHRLLLTKYPKPAKPKPPELPSVTVAACVNGLCDESILPMLQKLLNFKGIRVITLDAAINFCLQAYKNEMKEGYGDEAQEDERAASKKKGKKKGIGPKGKKKTAKAKEADTARESDYVINQGVSKEVQTPKLFPDDVLELSKAAQLGKQLHELALLGETVPDRLVAAAFVQFLQSMMEIKGWALINFPFNIKQAACLEEALTARPFPLPYSDDENQLSDIIEVHQREDCDCKGDCKERLRRSRILPHLEGPTDDELLYVTRLSAFINIKQASDDLSEDLTELPPLGEILEPGADPLERFYTEQGCNYTFYYKVFDTHTIKHLAKLIVGEFSIPPKTSLELFGDGVWSEKDTEEAVPLKRDQSRASRKIGEKKPKVKKVGKEKEKVSGSGSPSEVIEQTGKKGKQKKQVIVKITFEDKETQVPEIEEEIIEVFVGKEAEALPGEDRWVYVDLPLSDQFQTILATSWETTEDIYTTDLKQLFFVRRTLLDGVIPYVSYVKRHMMEFIRRPDDKFKYITEFQRAYNAFDADMRDDDEVKAELHCRVFEFREKLWTICDVRREECENERRRLISDNWFSIQVAQLTNNAITMLQVELDRYVDTMQLLSDYYLAAITHKPLDVAFNKNPLHPLKSNTRSSNNDPAAQLSSKQTTAIESMFTNSEANTAGSPFHDSLQKAHNEASAYINEIYATCVEVVKKGSAILAPTKDKKAAKGKKVDELDPEVKEKADAAYAEWKVALDGEMERATLQLSLLKAVGGKDLDDVFRCGQEAFHGVLRDIEKRYKREIESIEAACRLFASAIEAEVPLQPQLILEGDRFYVQPDVVLFPDELPPSEPPKPEVTEEGVFKISQLERIFEIMQDLAPSGLMIGRKFSFLLQDLITLDAEDGQEPMVPALYKQLTPRQVELFLKDLFGNTELIDWRDFIIYHLHIPFPTEDELLGARSELRQYDPDNTELVKDYQFFTAKLWFETVEERVLQIKNLLFKMYRINQDTLNYTPMLLAFCKDENVTLGIAKALELSLGRYVCWDTTLGEACVQAVISQRLLDQEARQQHDAEREENFKAATAIIDDIIDHTVHVCDSVVIEDVISSSSSVGANNVIDSKWMNPDLHVFSSVSVTDDEVFSEVGKDAAPSPGRVYFLPFETLMTVITAAFSWHATVQNLLDESLRQHVELVYESCRNGLFNGAVLAHELLNNKHFLRVIQVNFKFIAKEPVRIIKELLAE